MTRPTLAIVLGSIWKRALVGTGASRTDRGDAPDCDSVCLWVKGAHDLDLLASERLRLVHLIEAINIIPRLEYEFPATLLHVKTRTIRVGLQVGSHIHHFLVRFVERMNVQGTLRVRNFTAESCVAGSRRLGRDGSSDAERKNEENERSYCGRCMCLLRLDNTMCTYRFVFPLGNAWR